MAASSEEVLGTGRQCITYVHMSTEGILVTILHNGSYPLYYSVYM